MVSRTVGFKAFLIEILLQNIHYSPESLNLQHSECALTLGTDLLVWVVRSTGVGLCLTPQRRCGGPRTVAARGPRFSSALWGCLCHVATRCALTALEAASPLPLWLVSSDCWSWRGAVSLLEVDVTRVSGPRAEVGKLQPCGQLRPVTWLCMNLE